MKRDGTLVAHEADVYYNGGSYSPTPRRRSSAATPPPAPTAIPNIHVDSYGVYTNTLPASAFRGYGDPPGGLGARAADGPDRRGARHGPPRAAAQERPAAGDQFSTGETIARTCTTASCCGTPRATSAGAAAGPAPRRPEGPRPGPGRDHQGHGLDGANAVVKLNADGSLNVLTSTVEMGQGSHTVLAQIAAHEATLPLSSGPRLPRTRPHAVRPVHRRQPLDELHGPGHPARRRATSSAARATWPRAQLEAAPEDLEVADGRGPVRGRRAPRDLSRQIAAHLAAPAAWWAAATSRSRSGSTSRQRPGRGVAAMAPAAIAAPRSRWTRRPARSRCCSLHLGSARGG